MPVANKTAAKRPGDIPWAHKFVHKPDSRSLDALHASKSGVSGIIFLGIVFASVTALIFLAYFFLFVYNRLRHPHDNQEDADGALAADAARFVVKSDAQSQMILTKEDLQASSFRDSRERLESDRFLQRLDLERSEPKRRMSALRDQPSDAPSDLSDEGSYESAQMRRDSQEGPRESIQEISDGEDRPDRRSVPASELPPSRSGESARYSREESQQEKRLRQQRLMSKIEADYTRYVERESYIGSEQVMHQIDYSKYLLKK